MTRGKLITCEGIDGCGKTTQLRLLGQYFAEREIEFIATREPGGTELGRKIRALLLDGAEGSVEPLAELLLYCADRAQHVRRLILPALERGQLVLSDRFYDATTVYQGAARGFDPSLVDRLNELAACGLKPDLTLLFDLEVELALERTRRRVRAEVPGAPPASEGEAQRDRLDREPLDFHQRVRQAYLELARLEPRRFRVIPAGGTVEETFKFVVKEIEELRSPVK